MRADPNVPIEEDWERFIDGVRDEFYSPRHQADKKEEFRALKQGDDVSVQDYYRQFIHLMRFRADLVPTPQDKG